MIRPRYTVFAGLLFAVIGTVYFLLSRDAAGATMLIALSIAMWLMAYVLIAGSPRQS
jgi:hypothetical protein